MKTTLDGDKAIADHLTANGYPCVASTVRRWRGLSQDPLPHRRFFRRVLADAGLVLEWARRQGVRLSAA